MDQAEVVTLLVNDVETRLRSVGSLPSGKHIYMHSDAQGLGFARRKGVRTSSKAYRTAEFISLIEVAEAKNLLPEILPTLAQAVAQSLKQYRSREEPLHRMMMDPNRQRQREQVQMIADRELRHSHRLEVALKDLHRRMSESGQ